MAAALSHTQRIFAAGRNLPGPLAFIATNAGIVRGLLTNDQVDPSRTLNFNYTR
jgi:hypothetical protein